MSGECKGSILWWGGEKGKRKEKWGGDQVVDNQTKRTRNKIKTNRKPVNKLDNNPSTNHIISISSFPRSIPPPKFLVALPRPRHLIALELYLFYFRFHRLPLSVFAFLTFDVKPALPILVSSHPKKKIVCLSSGDQVGHSYPFLYLSC